MPACCRAGSENALSVISAAVISQPHRKLTVCVGAYCDSKPARMRVCYRQRDLCIVFFARRLPAQTMFEGNEHRDMPILREAWLPGAPMYLFLCVLISETAMCPYLLFTLFHVGKAV